MQQDELGQFARTPAIGDGTAQQLAHIHVITRLPGHPVGALVIIESRHRQPESLTSVVPCLGHDTAAGAATYQSSGWKLLFEVATQFLGIVGLGKIDQ